ncbi:Ctr copper transporter [Gilbertella persicaria]|uniref:Ctr copper transporter n=1 Tax=Gilbertella persicaria TaxID=101096 RepID=UPI002220BAB1|nr:Ctr copper transporter [Gilbertella persicaria]KAI8070581.1 Ctr copper transporter [Gilbertella persicaria]
MSHSHSMSTSSSSSSSSMSMSMGMGTFHWSSSGDGILLSGWVPQSEPAYIGACFGLFFFSILSRSLPALEAYFVTWRAMRHEAILLNSNATSPEPNVDRLAKVLKDSSSSSRSFNPAAYPEPLGLPSVPPFSWTTDTIRSFMSTLTSFVSYLLMMVVMTGNGGYFIVIIAGVFFGELAFGRFKYLTGGVAMDHSH